MFRWLCSPLFATANTIVFIHHLRRFLPSPYRIVWGVGCYVLSSTWPPYVAASMQVLILLRPSFLPFLLPPSLPFPPLFSAPPRWIGLNHCFLSPIAYSPSTGRLRTLHYNCNPPRSLANTTYRPDGTISMISSLDTPEEGGQGGGTSPRICFERFYRTCTNFNHDTASLLLTRLGYFLFFFFYDFFNTRDSLCTFWSFSR